MNVALSTPVSSIPHPYMAGRVLSPTWYVLLKGQRRVCDGVHAH